MVGGKFAGSEIMIKYEVIKDIPKGFESGANVGDILTVKLWGSVPTLMKGKKAVCDLDSFYGIHHCKKIEE